MDSLTVERTMKTRRDAFPIQISNRVAVRFYQILFSKSPQEPATDSRDKCLLILTARHCHHGLLFSPSPDVPWS